MKTQYPPIFRVRNISKVYVMGEVSVQALKNISLDLNIGELIVLLGASGSWRRTTASGDRACHC